jgi:outer membrane protein OmpA-like peptidoglycan-associated protein
VLRGMRWPAALAQQVLRVTWAHKVQRGGQAPRARLVSSVAGPRTGIFSFYGDQTDLQPSDVTMVNEIAGYMAQNPSLQIGIDGSTAPNGIAPTNQNLNDRRVDALHNALLAAGVPASKMQTGAFGDPQLRRDGRVEVLISTGSSSTARSDD